MASESKYSGTAKSMVIGIVIVILIVLYLSVKQGCSQTYSIGAGCNVVGKESIKLAVKDIHNIGGYVRLLNDSHTPTHDGLDIPDTEQEEYVFGLSYRIHDMITLTCGVGYTQTYTYFRTGDLASDLHSTLTKSISFELGCNIDLIKWNRSIITLDVNMNTYTYCNWVISYNVKID